MKVDYFVTANCEVLFEYANGVMAKYEKYLRSENALDCVRKMYKDLRSYNDKIICCDNQSEFDELLSNVKAYNSFIDYTISSLSKSA